MTSRTVTQVLATILFVGSACSRAPVDEPAPSRFLVGARVDGKLVLRGLNDDGSLEAITSDGREFAVGGFASSPGCPTCSPIISWSIWPRASAFAESSAKWSMRDLTAQRLWR